MGTESHLCAFADSGELRKRIDDAGRRGAGGSHDQKRESAGGQVSLDRSLKGFDIHPQVWSGRDDLQGLAADPGEMGDLEQGMVRFLRDVHPGRSGKSPRSVNAELGKLARKGDDHR